jgi:hypothetical protein
LLPGFSRAGADENTSRPPDQGIFEDFTPRNRCGGLEFLEKSEIRRSPSANQGKIS